MQGWILFGAAIVVNVSVLHASDMNHDQRGILRVEAAICRAFETRDIEALRKGLDDTFTLTDSRGVVTDLEHNLREVASGEPTYDVFRNHGQSVRLYGDAAIVTGVTSIEGRSGGEPFKADFQFTDTWVRRADGWKMAASHATRLPPRTP
jgi:ketosteroid isomerase-like protein